MLDTGYWMHKAGSVEQGAWSRNSCSPLLAPCSLLIISIHHLAMSLKLTYRGETPVPVEIEGLTPDWACDKSLAEIERFEIFHGNRKLPLAEMFSVSGEAAD